MNWVQNTISLDPLPRGMHLITDAVIRGLPELREYRLGMLNLFLQHTSASLTINENADPDVPLDLADGLDELAPERRNYRHVCEGPDDMPAHIKATLTGMQLLIPVSDGRMALGDVAGNLPVRASQPGRAAKGCGPRFGGQR